MSQKEGPGAIPQPPPATAGDLTEDDVDEPVGDIWRTKWPGNLRLRRADFYEALLVRRPARTRVGRGAKSERFLVKAQAGSRHSVRFGGRPAPAVLAIEGLHGLGRERSLVKLIITPPDLVELPELVIGEGF